MKKGVKIVLTVLLALVLLLLAAWLLVQTPGVQTFIVRKVADKLEENFNGRIEFSKIHFSPFNAIVVKDLSLIDDNPGRDPSGALLDTIASARTVVATFSLKGLLKDEGIHVKRLSVTDGSFTLTTEEGGNNIQRFFNSGGKEKTGEKKTSGDLFDADRVQIEGFRFRLVNLKDTTAAKWDYGMDWKDLDVKIRNLEAGNLKFSGGVLTGQVDDLHATEKSGYELDHLSGKVRVEPGKTTLEDVRVQDRWSDISMPFYSMEYEDSKSFSKYVEKVYMTGTIEDSRLDFRTLAYYAPSLEQRSDPCFQIRHADVEGTVTALGINRIEFTETGSGVSGSAEGTLTGLPDVKAMDMSVDVDNLSFNSEGLGKFIGAFSPESRIDLGKFARGEQFSFNGKARGTLDNLSVDGKVATGSAGSADADLKLENLLDKRKPIAIGGKIRTSRLDIGKIAGISQLGECSLDGAVRMDLEKGGPSIRIDSVTVDRLHALGYDYSNIAAAGTYTGDSFDGRIICNDPNLNFLLQGVFTLSDKTRNGLYNFYANVGYADLNALGFDKRGVSKVAGRIDANYMAVGDGNLIGDLDIHGLELENASGRHDIGDISIKSHANDQINRINLESGFARGSFVGTRPVTGLLSDIKDLTVGKEIPVLLRDTLSRWKGDSYDLSLDIADARDVLSFVLPGMYIADDTRVRMSIDKDGILSATVKSPRIAMNGNYIKDVNLALDNRNGGLNGALKSSETSAATLKFLNGSLMLSAHDNNVGLGWSYDNKGLKEDYWMDNKGELLLSGKLERDADGVLLIHGNTLPSSISYNGDKWDIAPSKIEVAGADITFDGLRASCSNQSLKIEGGFASTHKDTLDVDLDNFDIGLLNALTGQDFGIAGRATGHAMVTSPWKDNAGLAMEIACDSARLAGAPVGRLNLSSTLEGDGRIRLGATNDLGGVKTLDLSADYGLEDKRIDATARLDGLNVAYLTPVLKSVFSEMEGSLSGTLKASGKTDDLHVSSDGARFDNAMVRVAFTNVPYYLTGPLHVDDGGLHFDSVSVRDRYSGTGRLDGALTWGKLTDPSGFNLGVRLNVNDIEALDTDERQSESFYGNVYATGSVGINGPLNSLVLDVNARTARQGSLHIPLDNSSTAGKSDLLTFREPVNEVKVDPYEEMMNLIVEEKKKNSDLDVRLRITATQGTEAFLELDRTAGNMLNGRGQGIIDIDVRPNRNIFTINGDYTLNEGTVHVNAMDIAKRTFSIQDGSSVRFNGDVMDSDLDINGLYSTKASIATLLADTSAVSTRRLVNCGIGISGRLRSPRLSFSIDVPDLDPTSKSKVESALNTEDKVQRQFLSLLISGGFLPEEESGIVNNTNTLYSNVAEIMAGQLNNILEKLDIPLDFGLNYQESESGTSIFDVAVSTQLFNNRVLVNGAFGNREYSNSNSQGEMVGDLDVEIKLDKPGQLRLTLFSHSADDYTSYLDNTQRSGAGITFQKEFNSFNELVKDLFTSRRKRERRMQEAAAAAAQENRQREVKTIVITADEK